MKSKFLPLIAAVTAAITLLSGKANAQNWLTTGNSGITSSNFIGTINNADLIFRATNIERGRILSTSGTWRFGNATNFAKVDSTGKLSFGGTGAYQVAGNKYAFQYTGDPDYGLFFNSTNVRYEFRNGSAVPVFYVDANNGNSVFNGTLKVGAYTLPATDGTNGQVLKTNGIGVLSWSNDNSSGGGGANTSLSNLTATTINQSLLAATDNAIDLGSSSKSWRNIYVGNSLYLKGNLALHSPGINNFFAGSNAGNTSLTGTNNTGTGQAALLSNTFGSYNTANGSLALYSNTLGVNNTANGSSALYSNTLGFQNTATGTSALYFNTTGSNNTATGFAALNKNTTGNNNTATGTFALSWNTTGSSNAVNGYNALYSNTTGYSNTAVGVAALFNNTDRSNLVAVGDSALYNNGIGVGMNYEATQNTAVGSKSLFSNTLGYQNTATGSGALYTNSAGSNNTANGFRALYSNTGGENNTAIGSFTLYSNISGFQNTALGDAALYYNTYGDDNTATGFFALYRNATGSENTANGKSALNFNTTGSYNTAIGSDALLSNTTGSRNTATGSLALFSDTSGYNNTATGSSALYKNSSGYNNTAIGYNALYYNNTGFANAATGYQALYSNTTGFYNTAVGNNALYFNGTGNYNTANGMSALFSSTSGNYNTANGFNALNSNTAGSNNTAFGANADVSVNNLNYASAIGADAIVDASYKVRIGSTSIGSIGGQVGWTIFSDGRYKKNIKENVPGLAFINSLRPITYTVDMNALNEYYNKGRKQASENKEENINAERAKAADRSSKIVYDGFIAQEVEEAAKKLNFDFSGVDKPQSKDAVYGLRYDNFVVPLVKAVQELSKINNDKTAEIDELKKQNSDQQKQIDELKSMMQLLQQNFEKCNPCSQQPGISNQQSTSGISAASLEQNIPNPFNYTTTINYTLPATYTTAKIIITNEGGKVMKEINISGSGKGSLQVNASMFASGVYNYSLYANSRLIETKKMIK